MPRSGGKPAAHGDRDCPPAGSRRPGTAAHALARRPAYAYPAGGHRPRGEPARPIPIGGSSSAVPCNKIFETPSSQGGSKSTARLSSTLHGQGGRQATSRRRSRRPAGIFVASGSDREVAKASARQSSALTAARASLKVGARFGYQ